MINQNNTQQNAAIELIMEMRSTFITIQNKISISIPYINKIKQMFTYRKAQGNSLILF